MKQFNKQTGKLNTNALDDYIFELKQKEKNKKRETGLLIVLILIGFSGLYYIFYHAQPESYPVADHSDLDVISSSLWQAARRPKITAASSTNRQYPAQVGNEPLLIKGARETHLPMVFILDSYDNKAGYTLYFGDGQSQEISNKKTYHIYEKPGSYKVMLGITYKGVTKKLYSGKVHIISNIEIAEGAEREFQ